MINIIFNKLNLKEFLLRIQSLNVQLIIIIILFTILEMY